MQISDIIFTVVVLIISVIIHEVSHGYAANALGDPTARLSGRLTLNPLPHIDIIGSIIVPALLVISGGGILFGWAKPVPYNPYNLRNKRWGEAIVAFAGPGANLLLAIIFALIVRFSGDGLLFPASFGEPAASIVFVNLFLGLFNLIPFPPMDGFTVLRGLLPFNMSYSMRAFGDRIQMLGAVGMIAILLVFVTLLSGPFSAFVSYIFNILIGP